jgi:hypothetical protein
MRHLVKITVLSVVCILAGSFQVLQAEENQDSVLVQMFKWFNVTYVKEQAFTEEGFAQYFTDDIVFELNGKRSPKGLKSLTERFNKLKDTYYRIEIILPMKEEFSSGNRIFTYHLNRGKIDESDPWSGFSHVMGWADIKDGKIDFINFANYDEVEPSE